MIKKSLFILVLITLSHSSLADKLSGPYTVSRIFAEGASRAGFYPAEGLAECTYGLFYIDLTTESGKAILSLVLTAKSTGQKVVRVDYDTSESETCTVSGLHIQ
jgi:hypothetical protein